MPVNFEKFPLPWRACRWFEGKSMDGQADYVEPEDQARAPIIRIEAANGAYVATAHDLFEFDPDVAQTLSAAGEMLAALKQALPVLEAVQRSMRGVAAAHGLGGDGPVIEAVRAAIAKAEGQR